MSVTIRDIANIAGVSHTTVSRVLNGSDKVKKSTRIKIEQVIDKLNFTPSAVARGLSLNKTSIIGLVVPELRNPFFGEVFQGVSEIADKNDLTVMLFNTDEQLEKEKKVLRILQEYRIQGLIITPATGQETYDKEYIEAFKKMNIPIVLVDRTIIDSEFDGVYFDDTKAIYDATYALLKEGHRNIVTLGGNKNLKLAVNRVNGYKLAYKNMGLQYDEGNIFFDDFTRESAYNQTLKILRQKKLTTAIIANNNMLTMGCLKALFEKGVKIPEDIAFIGYDKIEMLDIIKSNISIVEKDAVQMGRNAMKILLMHLDDEEDVAKEIKTIVMKAKLVARGSEKFYSKS